MTQLFCPSLTKELKPPALALIAGAVFLLFATWCHDRDCSADALRMRGENPGNYRQPLLFLLVRPRLQNAGYKDHPLISLGEMAAELIFSRLVNVN